MSSTFEPYKERARKLFWLVRKKWPELDHKEAMAVSLLAVTGWDWGQGDAWAGFILWRMAPGTWSFLRSILEKIKAPEVLIKDVERAEKMGRSGTWAALHLAEWLKEVIPESGEVLTK